MTFDLYANGRLEKIDHHEEYIFEYAGSNKEQFPLLCNLWAEFYNDPCFSAEEAKILISELTLLNYTLNPENKDKHLAYTLSRLGSFFSYVVENKAIAIGFSDER